MWKSPGKRVWSKNGVIILNEESTERGRRALVKDGSVG